MTVVRLALTLAAATWAVGRADARNPPVAVEHFEKSVRPLLVGHCLSCHGGDAKAPKGGLNLTSRAGLLAGGDSGPAVVPGDPERSPLLVAIRHDGELKMPPKGEAEAAEIAAVAGGSRTGPSGRRPPGPTRRRPACARGRCSRRSRSGSGRFSRSGDPPRRLFSGRHGSVPDRRASSWRSWKPAGCRPRRRRTSEHLIRRVTFDLTGLPPTPEEIDAFLADDSPDAFETVVDRLLASPAYGERWGRHWLDVARYADSNGLDENTAFANAWRYRDYVVRALQRRQAVRPVRAASSSPATCCRRRTTRGSGPTGSPPPASSSSARSCSPSRTSRRCCSTSPTSSSTRSARGSWA